MHEGDDGRAVECYDGYIFISTHKTSSPPSRTTLPLVLCISAVAPPAGNLHTIHYNNSTKRLTAGGYIMRCQLYCFINVLLMHVKGILKVFNKRKSISIKQAPVT